MSRIRTWVSTIIAAVLSGVYWLLFFFVAEGFTASDYRSGMQPSEPHLTFKVAVVVVVGPLIYAGLIVLWRHLGRALFGRT